MTLRKVFPSARLLAWLMVACLGLALFGGGVVTAAVVPTGFIDSLVAGGLTSPTAMAFAPDGRLFVTEQGGKLRVIKNGALLDAPFLTVNVDASVERGLLGVAFDPFFATATTKWVYVYYTTATAPIHNRISRFAAAGDVATGSEQILFDLNNLSTAGNHNGGAIHFGSDGKLYVAVGENANGANSQSLSNLLGKMLRINPDGTIPTDNPATFGGVATTGQNRAIWAIGLRNPFTFTFQPNTSNMFINDVGQSTWEEINTGIKGANYGWPDTEGATTDPRFVSPFYTYNHSTGGCAITGGAFYNPLTAQFPADHVGDYFFADYCGGWIKRLDVTSKSVSNFASGISAPVDIQVSSDGYLYYLARGAGSVFKIGYTSGQGPTIGMQPANQSVAAGQSATFLVSASGAAPLAYQWQRNAVDIPGATQSSYTLASAQVSDSGARFKVRVSNAFGSVLSNEATLTVTANQPPTATITLPAAGTTYAGGQTISYAGTGSDPEDGPNLAASQFTWQVDFHHDTHIHPFMAATSGSKSGSFVIPTIGETSSNVWYRILLTVRDSFGNTNSTYRDVLPRTASVTLATNPSGLQLKLDGQPQVAPMTFVGVVGIDRTIEAPQQQVVNGTTLNFVSWSDGGARIHTISTPASATIYTATYQAAPPASPAFVKTIGGASLSRSGNAALTFTVPIGSGVAAHHTIVVAVTVGTFAGAVGCTDSKSNVYTLDADIRGTGRLFVCSARDVVALGPGDTVTATYPGFSGVSAMTASEMSGVSSLGTPSSVTRSGNSAAPSVPIAANVGDLLFGAVTFSATPSFTPGAGFTTAGEWSAGSGSGRKVVDAEYSTAASTSNNVTGNLTAPRPWLAAAVVYH